MWRNNGKSNNQPDKIANQLKMDEIKKYEDACDYIAEKINRQQEKLVNIDKKIKETKDSLANLNVNPDYEDVKKAYLLSHIDELESAKAKALRGINAYESSFYALSVLLDSLRNSLWFIKRDEQNLLVSFYINFFGLIYEFRYEKSSNESSAITPLIFSFCIVNARRILFCLSTRSAIPNSPSSVM